MTHLPPRPTDPITPPADAGDCVVCLHRPAADVTLRGFRGFIIHSEFPVRTGPFCRDCGIATFRELTTETLVKGWWSIISIFVMPVVLTRNLLARRKVAALGEPKAVSEFAAPNMRPLPLGKPVLAHPAPWISMAVLAAFVGFAFTLEPSGTSESDRGCVAFDRRGLGELVSCEEPHDATVIAVVSDWSLCPDETENHIEYLAKFYCMRYGY